MFFNRSSIFITPFLEISKRLSAIENKILKFAEFNDFSFCMVYFFMVVLDASLQICLISYMYFDLLFCCSFYSALFD
ncbi:hypothetical protein ACO02O_02481 [Dirofilaria immitis]